MKVDNATRAGLEEIARALGIRIINASGGTDAGTKIMVRPVKDSLHLRACLVARIHEDIPRPKQSLCLHGWYAFMSRTFARFPDAVIKTFITTWNYTLFEAGARAWTEQQLAERARYDTCQCTEEMVEDLLRPPSELAKVLTVSC